ncbi:SDR family oxidoreductase [Methylobacterium sp. NEAU 140]|uniref:SDR family oxidoreductase n=1 Tax=Methylobacterium sp. NEAU 140 TaxID=3064945 RepID=UPI0027353181|nr:SDR family oxidoreductase [Methylobacterium sp. NEAU 140]MDP4026295.1 SDR family oxidoreductase [Methylobacterium sp. NEAU 140]
MTHKPLRDQTIVVTGASSGIGLATARMAAERGARVVLTARSGAALDRIAAEIERDGGRAVAVAADVGERAEVEAVAARAVAVFGGFDTWVNVAGLTIYGPLRAVSGEDHERLMRTNFWGTVHGSLLAVEHLSRRGGALINVGSVASDLAFPLQGMYSASKHAVKGFTDALRMELRQENAPVSVTLVKPTSIDTPLPRRARNYMDREPMLPPPVYRPEEVAHAILHAAVHPTRDVFVGGAGKLFAAAKEFAPGAYDLLAPAIVAMQKRSGQPRRPDGALHGPEQDDTGHARGDQPGYVMRTSAYTRASLDPLAAMGTVAALGLAATALIAGGRRGRGG